MTDSGAADFLESVLPKVKSLGFHAGQTAHHFYTTWLTETKQQEDTFAFAFSNKLWFSIQTHAPEMWSTVVSFPLWYHHWWMDLLRNDPVHVFVETTLLLSVLYMFVSRSKDWKENKKDKLTKQEEDDLIKEWQKNRAPLASSHSTRSGMPAAAKDVPSFVVHKIEGTKMQVSMDNDPTVHTVINFGTFDFLGMSAEFTAPENKIVNNNNNKDEYQSGGMEEKKEETDENMATEGGHGNPNEPTDNSAPASKNSKKKKRKKKNAAAKAAVVQDNSNETAVAAPTTTTSATTTTTKEDDIHEIVSKNPMKQASVEALKRYGVGACGPRGFYGTIDPHLKLEDAITNFMGSEGAILYSDGASTISSTVAAFCKRGDLLVVDEGVCEPLIAGVKLSRAYVKWFKHNDMDDLHRVLAGVEKNDNQLGRAPNAQRRFIICEGLYKNTGQIAALDKIVAMKHQFHYRLILDESFSFGTLGATGKGALELFNLKLMHDAEVVTIALENAMGSIGGVTIGNEEIVDHQRLSGSGYCFSASSPPFTASAAIVALNELKTRPNELLTKLNDNKQYMYDKLQTFCELQEDLILISSDIRSPIVFLVLAECAETEDIDETVFLSEVVRECLRRGVGMVSAGQHNTRAGVQLLRAEPQPSIRLSVSAAHTRADIDVAVRVLSEALGVVMHRYVEGEI